MKKLLIVLGNGFSIDFIRYLNLEKIIDVKNLFRDGANVPWPATNEPGFLSFKHCPNLWNLGARPNMDSATSMNLIEDIITCVNVYASNPNKGRFSSKGKPNEIYIHAYKELSSYLKRLFLYYNNKLVNIPDCITEWPWSKYLDHISRSTKYNEIHIVTYNYDIWLERILIKLNIEFDLSGFEDRGQKIKIYKPHGSISFKHKKIVDLSAYGIKYNRELLDGNLEDFEVGYSDLGNNFLVNAMIPPAGEAARFNHSWAGEIQTKISDLTQKLNENDDALICGLSYWHVDRKELDEILVNCHPGMNIKLINPNPSASLTAVIASIFDNFVHYPESEVLLGLIT